MTGVVPAALLFRYYMRQWTFLGVLIGWGLLALPLLREGGVNIGSALAHYLERVFLADGRYNFDSTPAGRK